MCRRSHVMDCQENDIPSRRYGLLPSWYILNPYADALRRRRGSVSAASRRNHQNFQRSEHLLLADSSFEPYMKHSLLASSPLPFAHASQMTHIKSDPDSFTMTNRGLQIDARLLQLGPGIYIMVLDCFLLDIGAWCGLLLCAVSDTKDFVCVNVGQFAAVVSRPRYSRIIYIAQPDSLSVPLGPSYLPLDPINHATDQQKLQYLGTILATQ